MAGSSLLPDVSVERGLRVVLVGGCARLGGLLAQSLAKGGATLVIVDWDSSDSATLGALRDACRRLGSNQTDYLTGKLDQEAEWGCVLPPPSHHTHTATHALYS